MKKWIVTAMLLITGIAQAQPSYDMVVVGTNVVQIGPTGSYTGKEEVKKFASGEWKLVRVSSKETAKLNTQIKNASGQVLSTQWTTYPFRSNNVEKVTINLSAMSAQMGDAGEVTNINAVCSAVAVSIGE